MVSAAIEYYELAKVVIEPPKPNEFRLVTAAVLECGLCCAIIDGMGGPGTGTLCTDCADDLKHGRLRGAVIRDHGSRRRLLPCQGCEALIDSDDDPECFVEVGNMRRLHKEIILCEPCRKRHAEQLDEAAALAHD